MADANPAIGELRWPVVIVRRDQIPVDEGEIAELNVSAIHARAKIEPVYAATYYGSAQVDTPVTHMIWLRWLDNLDTTHAVIRTMRRKDGTARFEVFRVRRVKELEGRQRFLMIEAELEQRQ